jgi:hypothetical protein
MAHLCAIFGSLCTHVIWLWIPLDQKFSSAITERENSLGFFSSNFEKNLLFSFLFLKTCLADEHSTYNISGAPLERPSSRKSLMSIKWSAQPKKCRKETKKNREPPTVCWLGASLSLLQIYFLAKISWKGKNHNPMASRIETHSA